MSKKRKFKKIVAVKGMPLRHHDMLPAAVDSYAVQYIGNGFLLIEHKGTANRNQFNAVVSQDDLTAIYFKTPQELADELVRRITVNKLTK